MWMVCAHACKESKFHWVCKNFEVTLKVASMFGGFQALHLLNSGAAS
jgi:hypothetical protein